MDNIGETLVYSGQTRKASLNPSASSSSRTYQRDSQVSSICALPTRRCLVTGRRDASIEAWSVRGMDFKFILSGIHWGTVVLTLLPLTLLLALSFAGPDPAQRAYVPDDPALKQESSSNHVPPAVQHLMQDLLFLGTLFLGEFWLFRPIHVYIENAIATFVFFLLDWLAAVLMGALFCEISMVVVGRAVPNFFEECQEMGQHGKCEVEGSDSRTSFFPMEPCLAMLTAIYSANYIVSLVYHRVAFSAPQTGNSPNPLCRPGSGGSWIDRIIEEIGHATLMYFIIVQVALAWMMGILAIINRDNFVSDVNSGMLVGGILGFLFSYRANSFLPRLPRKVKPPEISRNSSARNSTQLMRTRSPA